jgi:hypothetical protein
MTSSPFPAATPGPLDPVTRRAALTAGVLGLVANTAFVAFWSLTQPYFSDPTWGWLGPAGDVIGVGMLLALLPVLVGVRRLLPPGRVVSAVTALAAVATASMAVLQTAAVAELVDELTQIRLVVVLLVPLYGWLVVVSAVARRTDALPRAVSRLGLVLGLLWPAGLVLVLAGLLLTRTDPPPLPLGLPGGLLLAPGLLLGALGWLALPGWPLLLAVSARRRRPSPPYRDHPFPGGRGIASGALHDR